MHIFTRKTILTAAVAAISVSVYASDTEPAVAWINLFDGKTSSGDNGVGIVAVNANEIYWLNTLGSTTADSQLFYNGTEIFEGAPYNGTSVNNNLSLTKTDGAGDAYWTLYSNSGDFSATQGGLTSCPDGSVVFYGKVRHTDGMLDTPFCIVDASATEYKFGEPVEKRYYKGVVGKVEADGTLAWLRIIEPDCGTEDNFISDGLNTSTIACDDEGNIYIGGNYTTDITFATADGSQTVTTADATNRLFIAKLDSNGYYLGSVLSEGEPASASLLDLRTKGDKVYYHGYVSVAEGSSFSFAGKVLQASETYSPFLGVMDFDTATADWSVCMQGAKIGTAIGWQNAHLTVCDNTLWLAAQASGIFTDAAGAANTVTTGGTLRDGLLYKFDATTGAFGGVTAGKSDFPSANTKPENDLIGYFYAVQNPDRAEKVYVYGYNMTQKNVFLRGYDAETLAPAEGEDWLILTGGGVPSALGFAYLPESAEAFFTARGNAAFNGIGGVTSEAPEKWAVAASKLNLPEEFMSGIEEVAIGNTTNALTIVAGNGVITLSTVDACVLTIYNIAGRSVANIALKAGEMRTVELASGFYVAAGQKIFVK